MTVSPLVTVPISQLQLAPGSRVSIPNVSWQAFERLLQELGEHRAARVAYYYPILEIMVPLPEHEIPRDLISDLVKVLLRAAKLRYQPFGSTTFRKEGVAGVEPDACFYITNYQQMIGRRRLEPGDPPPNLAIETDVTSKTTLEAYQAIAVPELWIYSNSQLRIDCLQSDRYIEVESSPTFPHWPVRLLISQTVEQSWQVGSDQALEEFQAEVSGA
jgi:Uma2 family endonuclease